MERLNIPYCASAVAASLHRALKAGQLAKVGIDEVRAAVVGYLAAGPYILSKYDVERLVEATLRKTVERV